MAAAAIFSLLLVATGLVKLLRPNDTARALSMLGIPAARPATLMIGAAEVTTGALALITASVPTLAAQSILYSAFLIWIGYALVKQVPIVSCGCIGRDDTPPYWGHLMLNGFAVIASLGSIGFGPVSPNGLIEATAHLLIVGIGAAMAWAVLGVGAQAAGQVRP